MTPILPPDLEGFRALSESEAAAILGVSRGTLANWRFFGRGPRYFRAGSRAIRYALSEILRYRDEHAITPGVAR